MSPDSSQAAKLATSDEGEGEGVAKPDENDTPTGEHAEAAAEPPADAPESSSEPEPSSEPAPAIDERIASLRTSLLELPQASSNRRPESRWAYPLWGIFVVSLFVAYHVAVLLVWNTPNKGLNKDFHKQSLDALHGQTYFNATRNTQSWAMFAPNPNRSNTFIRVIVEDQEGELWDFGQDIWGNNRYPYVWYDRRGKINRRIDGKKHYQRIYGAWVCREWERQHGGEPPKSVSFIKRWTKVPKPDEVIAKGGWDPWEAEYKQKEQETITCKTTPDAQLTNELRERYGLPLVDDSVIRTSKSRTWWDEREQERKKAEREAKAAEARERWKNKGGAGKPERAEVVELDPRGPIREEGDEPIRDEGDEIVHDEED